MSYLNDKRKVDRDLLTALALWLIIGTLLKVGDTLVIKIDWVNVICNVGVGLVAIRAARNLYRSEP